MLGRIGGIVMLGRIGGIVMLGKIGGKEEDIIVVEGASVDVGGT